jgi:hypothetical protein
MYEKSLKENAMALAEWRKTTFVSRVPSGGAGRSKRADVGGQPLQ